MTTSTFGEFLRSVRIRTKGTQVAKNAGISYVYLLDIEKGARQVPSKAVLLALADNLPFLPGEKEMFFDLAAAEKSEAPIDVVNYIFENKDLVKLIRELEKSAPLETDSLSRLLKKKSEKEGEI